MGSITEKAEVFPNVPADVAPDIMWDLKIRLTADKTPGKVDLGAGVYKDEEGKYYELPVIHKAKKILAAQPVDHNYGFNTGDPAFLKKAAEVIFGKDSEVLRAEKVASIQTIAGTGACHLGAVFSSHFFRPDPSAPPPSAYVGAPAWPNYEPLFTYTQLAPTFYPHYDYATKHVAFDSLLQAAADAPPRSVFVLQAVCHNPTGRDLSRAQWVQVAEALEAKGHLPFFDIAYQGFGAGLEEDAWPIREFVRRGLQVVVAQSFSKNLGLYGERVGVLHVVAGSKEVAVRAGDQLRSFARWTWASPPRYAATLAKIVMEEFWDEWLDNLRVMRERLQKNRKNLHWWLTEELKTPGNWDHILEETGLFSLLALTPAQVERMASEDHIHFPTTGRINVAGLTETNVETLARSVDKVVR
ncbi:Aspartate aminotransferase [Lasiodiplodia hormozganensis]|uniref:Aspartate aminotransferase n=1 Tax=Lasiodiplodia hormozganensis TaxID=869390 RepID=A0AA39Z209_9PEZI|nr:Aspartate aminotransferase [Lasiodiplodia hormozganensis]